MLWQEVSSEYSGLFFRVVGGGSLGFGETQDENSPRLTQAGYLVGRAQTTSMNIPPGEWSPCLKTGGHKRDADCLSFYVSGGEVRPRNKAIRIWKRTN